MTVIYYPIKLNVKPSQYPLIRQITLVQGDTANVFAIELQENRSPFNIEKCTVTATFKKEDKNVVVLCGNVIDAINGIVHIPILSQVVSYPGKVYCTIEVYNENGLRLTSIMFEFKVVEQLSIDEDITSVSEYTILQELIRDVEAVNIKEEERVQNENTRILNEENRKVIFDNIVKTADATKDGLDTSIMTGNELKTILDSNIAAGNNVKLSLTENINNATTINDTLNVVITRGNELNNILPLVVENASNVQDELNSMFDIVNAVKTELDDSITTATTKKTELNTSIDDANNINNILSNIVDGTIKQATDINNTLNDIVDIANTSKINLDASIDNSNTAKTNLDDSISTANVTKTALDGSITEGHSLKGELDAIIAGTDYEQMITDVNNLKQDQHNHTNKGTLDGLSDMDGKLKYNGQDVGIGDMRKAEYDVDGDGIVDMANNSDKLGGQLPSYYAKTTDIPDISGKTDKIYVDTELDKKIDKTKKGVANGLAELDSGGKVPASQLPSYVDDVLEYNSLSTFPTTGETGKIYVATDTNLTYRWSGTDYVEISPSIALGETSSTAYRGDRGKIAFDHSQSTHARTDATKVENSTTNGNITINGTETNVYTHPTNHDDRYYTETEIDTKLSDKVDNSRVLTDVPANAKFTDTITTINGKTGAISKADITALGIPAQDTTYGIATTSTNGLMSATDKIKLNGIEAGANKTTISNTLTSTSTTQALSANQGKILNDKISTLNTDLTELKYSELSSTATNIDDEGIYQNIEWKRKDGTLYAKSTLIGTTPNYNQIKIDYYNETGTTIIKTITWDLTYDDNNFPYTRTVI